MMYCSRPGLLPKLTRRQIWPRNGAQTISNSAPPTLLGWKNWSHRWTKHSQSYHLLQADPKNSKSSQRFSTSGEFDVLPTPKICRLWFLHQLAFSKLQCLLWNHPNNSISFLSEIFPVDWEILLGEHSIYRLFSRFACFAISQPILSPQRKYLTHNLFSLFQTCSNLFFHFACCRLFWFEGLRTAPHSSQKIIQVVFKLCFCTPNSRTPSHAFQERLFAYFPFVVVLNAS